MQDRLIHALTVIAPHTNSQRIDRVLDAINSVIILPNDYKKVAGFIILLTEELPDILTAKPHDEPLKALCLDCLEKIPNPTSPRPKA
jgi:hypothetical protein